MSVGFGESFGFEYYGGAGTVALAPFTFPIGLGDFAYNLDYTQPFNFRSVPYIRQQSDQSESPGEHSLNPAGLWRRSADSWHLGAGQTHFDRPKSSPYRFRSSLGMDIWTRWALSLLTDTDQKKSSANTNLRVAVAGSHLYLTDGTSIQYTTNVDVDTPTMTDITGEPANAATSIISDGFNVWTAHGTNGVYKTTRGAGSTVSTVTGTVSLLGFTRGRVMAANANVLYDITAQAYTGAPPVALPTALFTNSNTDFVFKAFAESRNAVYAAGYSGDKSIIYKMVLKSDGTGLDAPTVCAEFDGADEQIEGLYGYLGPFMVIGQAKGWRFALVNENGDLTVGARVVTPTSVRAFEGQNNFIWFGYGNYDATHTGLGRLNVQEFGDADGLVPAYASDLMVLNQTANILSVVTFQGIRVFTVDAVGVYAEHHSRNLVSSGTLETGEISFKMNEGKIGLYFDVTHLVVTGGTHSCAVSSDSGIYVDLGTHTEHHMPFIVGEVNARVFEFKIGLQRDSVTATNGQTLTSWLFRCQPVPSISTAWQLPLLISDTVHDLDGNPHPMEPFDALNNLLVLLKTKAPTVLNVNGVGYSVVVEDLELIVAHLVGDYDGLQGFNGTANVTLKDLAEAV